MLLLALDTSTPQVGVALVRDGTALAGRSVIDDRRHGELLAVGIDAVLAEAALTPRHLDGIAVGVGPGPYTGLRIGLMTARAMGHALGVGVHGVCSLDVLAEAAGIDEDFLVVTDARRKEVYWARYREGGRIGEPAVTRPQELGWAGPVCGAGALLYPDCFPDARGPHHPDPVDLARIVERAVAEGSPTLPPLPLYLRRPDAAPPGQVKAVGQPRADDGAARQK